jgi:hypothetical protein
MQRYPETWARVRRRSHPSTAGPVARSDAAHDHIDTLSVRTGSSSARTPTPHATKCSDHPSRERERIALTRRRVGYGSYGGSPGIPAWIPPLRSSDELCDRRPFQHQMDHQDEGALASSLLGTARAVTGDLKVIDQVVSVPSWTSARRGTLRRLPPPDGHRALLVVFGSRVRERRGELGWSQRRLTEWMGVEQSASPCSSASLKRWISSSRTCWRSQPNRTAVLRDAGPLGWTRFH